MERGEMMDDSTELWINEKFSRGLVEIVFSHYHKYEFYWKSDGDLDFRIEGSYGGDADRIYRYPVSSDDRHKIKSLDHLKQLLTSIEIYDHQGEMVYSWEEGQ